MPKFHAVDVCVDTRIAGRIAFTSPELETGGAADDSDFYDEEAA